MDIVDKARMGVVGAGAAGLSGACQPGEQGVDGVVLVGLHPAAHRSGFDKRR